MANAPTVTSFSSSAEAFKYPLPTVRQFHKQLQVTLDEKNARLRTLVGGSYRQLLGTAETIVDMRRNIELAENKLARIAEGCSRTAVGKKVAGLGKLGLARDINPDGKVDLSWLARMKVLQGCVLALGRLLRGKESGREEQGQSSGGRLVTAAKVLVLSRLLTKTLKEDVGHEDGKGLPDNAGQLIEEMTGKVLGLRYVFLRSVQRLLVKVEGEREDLLQALCGYSLATSSGAREVLRHFMHVRGEAIALALDDQEQGPGKATKEDSMLRALGLYTRTLLDIQALVPRQLSDALLSLKDKPLLKDDAVRGLEGLRIDIHEKWFGNDIKFFRPFIRHDELEMSQVVEMLSSWAKKASDVLLRGFQKTLGHVVEMETVVEIRTKIFEFWISEGGKVRAFNSSILLDELRKVVNDRLVNLIEARIKKLHLVGTEVAAVLNSFSSGLIKAQGGLWNSELLDMDLSGGAGDFKEAIMAGVHGRNDTVSRIIKGYEIWRHLIDELFTIIDQLKNQRWEDNLESFEDDDVLENRRTLLSEDDPQMLEDNVDTELEQAYKDLHQTIDALLDFHHNSEHFGTIAKFILRVLRDIRASLPKRPDLKSFGLSMIPTLHGKLAIHVSSIPISSFVSSISKQKNTVWRDLWEGEPQLPIQPSPITFRFLHSLESSMASAGSDLWSPAAVGVLKHHILESLSLDLPQAVETLTLHKEFKANGYTIEDKQEPNGIGDEDSRTDGELQPVRLYETFSRVILIQTIFDILLLQHCLHTPNIETGGESLSLLVESWSTPIHLSTSEMERLHQAAQDYWKRSSLLFGLL